MADQYIEVPGGTNNFNYANVDVIVEVAERAGVHAVWAGWYVLTPSSYSRVLTSYAPKLGDTHRKTLDYLNL